jgi:hypothetical protein
LKSLIEMSGDNIEGFRIEWYDEKRYLSD